MIWFEHLPTNIQNYETLRQVTLHKMKSSLFTHLITSALRFKFTIPNVRVILESARGFQTPNKDMRSGPPNFTGIFYI